MYSILGGFYHPRSLIIQLHLAIGMMKEISSSSQNIITVTDIVALGVHKFRNMALWIAWMRFSFLSLHFNRKTPYGIVQLVQTRGMMIQAFFHTQAHFHSQKCCANAVDFKCPKTETSAQRIGDIDTYCR